MIIVGKWDGGWVGGSLLVVHAMRAVWVVRIIISLLFLFSFF